MFVLRLSFDYGYLDLRAEVSESTAELLNMANTEIHRNAPGSVASSVSSAGTRLAHDDCDGSKLVTLRQDGIEDEA